jgi:hypothetical protein
MPVRKRNRTALTGKHATPTHPSREGVSTPALRDGRVPERDMPKKQVTRKDELKSPWKV